MHLPLLERELHVCHFGPKIIALGHYFHVQQAEYHNAPLPRSYTFIHNNSKEEKEVCVYIVFFPNEPWCLVVWHTLYICCYRSKCNWSMRLNWVFSSSVCYTAVILLRKRGWFSKKVKENICICILSYYVQKQQLSRNVKICRLTVLPMEVQVIYWFWHFWVTYNFLRKI